MSPSRVMPGFLFALLSVCASGAWGIIIPVGGSVSALAQTSSPGFGSQISSPAAVTIGTALGSYVNQAVANSGAAHADITTTWSQSATSLSLSITGDVHKSLAQNEAEAFGGAQATFSLDAPAMIQTVSSRTSAQSGLSGYVKIANGNPVMGFSTVDGDNFTMLFPAGTYTLVTQSGGLRSPTNPGETATVTLTIVPEPSTLALGGAVAMIITLKRRRVGF